MIFSILKPNPHEKPLQKVIWDLIQFLQTLIYKKFLADWNLSWFFSKIPNLIRWSSPLYFLNASTSTYKNRLQMTNFLLLNKINPFQNPINWLFYYLPNKITCRIKYHDTHLTIFKILWKWLSNSFLASNIQKLKSQCLAVYSSQDSEKTYPFGGLIWIKQILFSVRKNYQI